MKFSVFVFVAAACAAASFAQKHTHPKVQVYSQHAGKFGKENKLICHVSGFYPPNLSIRLLKNKVELPSTEQTDLAFNQNWHFHLTKSVAFTPDCSEEYSCQVTHGIKTFNYAWDPNM